MNTYIYDKAKDCVIGPVEWDEPEADEYGNWESFDSDFRQWHKELASLPSYPVHPSLKLKEGKVIEGVDFVLRSVEIEIKPGVWQVDMEKTAFPVPVQTPKDYTCTKHLWYTNDLPCPCCYAESHPAHPSHSAQPAEAGKGEAAIKSLAIAFYGNDPYLYGGQREGFVKGYKAAMNTTPASQQFTKEEMVGFAEWISPRGWAYDNLHETWQRSPDYEDPGPYTTPDLLNLYLETIKKQ